MCRGWEDWSSLTLGLVVCSVDSDGGDGLYCHVETEHEGAVVFDGGGGDWRHLRH